MSAIVRDSQRSRLYKAQEFLYDESKSEWAIKFNHLDLNSKTSIYFCQRYVNLILSQKFITKRFGERKIWVKSGRGGGKAYGSSFISLGLWARNESIVLHEIAHCLAPRNVKHGPEFAGIYLFLVKNVFGNEAAAKLRQSYKAHGVRYTNKAIPVIQKKVMARV